jgi:hypothetical protein
MFQVQDELGIQGNLDVGETKCGGFLAPGGKFLCHLSYAFFPSAPPTIQIRAADTTYHGVWFRVNVHPPLVTNGPRVQSRAQ